MPRRTSSLFHPQRTLQLGNGMSVQMDRATDSDLLAWSRLSRRNRSRTDLADNEVQDYIDKRIDAFRRHPGLKFLGDLERIDFGYTSDVNQPAEGRGMPRPVPTSSVCGCTTQDSENRSNDS
jgi:hypothetical protein